MKQALGIDLGTTNTVTAINGKVVDAEDGVFLPSVVAFLPSSKRLVGAPARRRLGIDPTNTIASAKRLIGRSFGGADAQKFASRYSYKIEEGEEGRACFATRAGLIDPIHVGAHIVGHKMAHMSLLPGETRAIVAVPSMFRQPEVECTQAACKLAGISTVEPILEPVATALAYLEGNSVKDGNFVVYDLGGGTFDMAVVSCQGGELEIVAHGGDLYLGGDDVDHSLASWVADHVLKTQRWDLRSSSDVFSRLIGACEEAKIRLSFGGTAEIDLGRIDTSASLQERIVNIDTKTLQEITTKLVTTTFVICDEVMHRSGHRVGAMDEVFLAGGCTQLPIVRDAVAAYFGKSPRSDFDPMEVIGIGSSIAAAKRWG